MTINVVEALDADTATPITVERVDGSYVDGLYQLGTPTTFKALASAQQPTPKQIEFLPDGERQKDLKAFYMNKQARTSDQNDGKPADIIIHRGKRYKVVNAGDWEDYGWFFAIGAREN